MISKEIYILTKKDLFDLLHNSYHDAQMKQEFDFDKLISTNELDK